MLTPFSDHLVSAQDLLIICTNCTILQITLLFFFELVLSCFELLSWSQDNTNQRHDWYFVTLKRGPGILKHSKVLFQVETYCKSLVFANQVCFWRVYTHLFTHRSTQCSPDHGFRMNWLQFQHLWSVSATNVHHSASIGSPYVNLGVAKTGMWKKTWHFWSLYKLA